MMGGDFNLIRNLDEKKRAVRQLNPNNERFRVVIEALNLVDLRTSNGLFTWNNKRSGDRSITSHLDRFLVSKSVLTWGGEISAMVLPSDGPDHWPIILDWINIGVNPQHRFEPFWLLHLEFPNLLKSWWKEIRPPNGTVMYHFQQKLKYLKIRLKDGTRSPSGTSLRRERSWKDL